MPAAHCPICFNDFAIDSDKPEFLIFPCGHGFCARCTERLFNDARVKCPNCRKIIHRRDAHPVYLQLVDSKTVFTTSVVEGMDQMDADTPLVSVKKASQKMSKALDMNPPNDNLTLLLKAVQDFNERIIPLFTKVEAQKKEIDHQRQDLHKARQEKDAVQSQLNKVAPLQMEVVHLRTALAETENNTQEAIRLAETAKDKLEKQCVVTAQWQKQAGTMEQENKRFIDVIQRHQSFGQKQREKCKKLEAEITFLREQLNAQEQEQSQTMSDATNDYDGDFSGHEYTRVHTTLRIASSPSRSPHQKHQKENNIELDFEGLRQVPFPSDWQPHGTTGGVLKKRTSNGIIVSNNRRVTNPFPINLDKKGRPTSAVQLGPKSTVRVGR